MIFSHDVPGGAAWSMILRRHRAVRLECLGPGANVSTLIYAADRPLERLNVPDTLKAQMAARIAAPMVLMSDLGKALCSVTGSSLTWHDAISGHSLDAHVPGGPTSYAEHRNDRRRSARDGLLEELWKHGLGERDLHATVNFFSKVAPTGDERGGLAFVHGHARTGDWVELRAEQDVLIMLSTAPHPLATAWSPAAVRATVRAVPAPGPDDPSRVFRDESGRALAEAERTYQ
ncbi:urea amidolyase associated protein UAAP1 [Spirillospora sp. NPDC047279]|uniref:urea amidolyase associated protein UAAP1 n=1 Tax=Spirillospora sp. NPDC047279 TaxID=3155478 RepID=UPI0033CB029D